MEKNSTELSMTHVSGSLPHIHTYQFTHNLSLFLVIRTRIDGLWTSPPENLPLVWEKKEEKNKNNTLIGLSVGRRKQGREVSNN